MLDLTHTLIYHLLHGFPNLRHSVYWATVNKDGRVSDSSQNNFTCKQNTSHSVSVLEGSSYNFKDVFFHAQSSATISCYLSHLFNVIHSGVICYSQMKRNHLPFSWNVCLIHSSHSKNFVYTSAHPSVKFLIKTKLNFWIEREKVAKLKGKCRIPSRIHK